MEYKGGEGGVSGAAPPLGVNRKDEGIYDKSRSDLHNQIKSPIVIP